MEISKLAQVLNEQYQQGKCDYYMPPLVRRVMGDSKNRITDRDCVFFCVRRGDRQAQMLNAFCDPSFHEFPTERFRDLIFVPLVEHQKKLPQVEALFATIRPENTFGHIMSKMGLRQLRVGESEKASHVTYFFSGRRFEPYEGEDRIIVPSPEPEDFIKYPGTSTGEVARLTAEALACGEYSFIFANLAAGDIIGHIDNWKINVECAIAVDNAFATIRDVALQNGYVVAVTADHGLLERAFHDDGSPNLGHTVSSVPFGIIGAKVVPIETWVNRCRRSNPTLADVAPTLLNVMGINIPEDMTGIPLVVPKSNENPKKCILVLMDGWGIGPNDPTTNPIAAADVHAFTGMKREGFYTELAASGQSVGLPEGRSGNSETGHLTVGAGRVIPQDELRIAAAIQNGAITDNNVLIRACQKVTGRDGAAHVVMVLSDKSSHGNMSEGIAVARAASENGVRRIYLHLIMDGRSSPPRGGASLLYSLKDRLGSDVPAQILTAVGRGYALDRSGKYIEHIAPAYRAMVYGQGHEF